MKKIGSILLFLVTAAAVAVVAAQSQRNFISVEGPDLKSRFAAAVNRGGTQGGRFWLAYTFAVKPGVAFDATFIGGRGSTLVINGKTVHSHLEKPNLGVFLLYAASDRAIVRAEIYNLDRPRDYAGYPVYWLGHGPGNESLPLLRGLIDTIMSKNSDRLADAIGAHDDPEVPTVLRHIARNAKSERARRTAVSWLGHWPEQTEFLAAFVRDKRELVTVRREAVEALGEVETSDAIAVLQQLAASNDDDRKVCEDAIEALGDMQDDRAVAALAQSYDMARDEQTKEAILDALGDAETGPALQKLMAVAQRDPSIKLRRRAIALLGESEDPVAFKFLEELIK